jgi:serine protease Do
MFDRRKSGFLRTFLIIVASSLGIGVLLFISVTGLIANNSPQIKPPQQQAGTPDLQPQPQQLGVDIANGTYAGTTVAKNSIPGVVGISVLKVDSDSIFQSRTSEKWGVGSGVIVTSNGYILTNNHVAGGKNKRIVISFHDGSNLDGKTVWADPVLDLAIVKVTANNLRFIPLGNAETLQVGEPAIAIGNPLGLQFQRTVTSGIISALNRTIKVDNNFMEDLIQTDASINPGNSGGPLLNSRGEVVGINTIKVSSAEGLGFAVPINVAVPIINKFKQKGSFKETYMGVFAYDKEIIPYLNNKIRLDNGIYVVKVDAAGPAAKSGIKVGCIITEVDGNKINTMLQLRTYLYTKIPGDTINVTHLTGGKSMRVPIKLAAKNRDGLVTR